MKTLSNLIFLMMAIGLQIEQIQASFNLNSSQPNKNHNGSYSFSTYYLEPNSENNSDKSSEKSRFTKSSNNNSLSLSFDSLSISSKQTDSTSSLNTESISFSSRSNSSNRPSYFIEKPNENWKTNYFNKPVVFKAIQDPLHPTNLIILEPSYFKEMQSDDEIVLLKKHFIECPTAGSAGDIDAEMYQKYVRRNAPAVYEEIVVKQATNKKLNPVHAKADAAEKKAMRDQENYDRITKDVHNREMQYTTHQKPKSPYEKAPAKMYGY